MKTSRKQYLKKYEETLRRLADRINADIYVEHFRTLADDPEGIHGYYGVRELRKDTEIPYAEQISPRGGKTIVTLFARDTDEELASGVAFCNGVDNFDATEGRILALRRALVQAVGQGAFRETVTKI